MAEGDLLIEDGSVNKFNGNSSEANVVEEQEPNFDDPDDFIDDISDEELLGDILKNKPTQDLGLKSVIIVDGIPQVSQERFEKLRNVLMKLFSKCGVILKDYFPLDENNTTKGYAFFEFENSSQAQEATKNFNGHKLDKHHVFSVNMFQDIDKFLNIPDEFEEPTKGDYVDRGNLRDWLQDPDCFDQYSVVYEGGDKTAVYLNSSPEPTLVNEREFWTEQSIHWSPYGTYMATFHKQGIALWGGPGLPQMLKFAHEGVTYIDFSPCENYLVTLSQSLMLTNQENAITVWDVRMQAVKRTFYADNSTLNISWPILKWSYDDKYFARISNDSLYIYETETFSLLEKKSMKINGIQNFSWSPSQNILAYWVAEDQNVPARVALIEIPSKVELRAKNLFSVADCKMHWQKNGDYLCVKVDRYTKAKKERNDAAKYTGMYYNFELFHLREKQIPVDSIEIKEPIICFSWEPVGSKFAIIHGDSPLQTVSFYGIKQGTTVALLKKFEQKTCNTLSWSPTGQFILTDIEWDPTGRYVATIVSYWTNKADNAYWIWSFQGRLIRKQPLERLCQFLWRPRPPSILSEEKVKEIRKNLKKYAEEFDAKDRLAHSKLSKEIIAKRQQQIKEYKQVLDANRKIWEENHSARLALRGLTEEPEIEYEEEEYEILIKEETIELENL
ncbi:hypothetical protein RDWZM_005588 [Blomia tropicalis]|uniref:Eukaryotic translation initiation factor 3 subunit B n=1 Tax=Blomia tropicalis TaxID=40697 RepID=A0A9Q0RNK6_BLOTA|nr:hypothetical protein RDWZM_005588 [Blomia tropicalis]